MFLQRVYVRHIKTRLPHSARRLVSRLRERLTTLAASLPGQRTLHLCFSRWRMRPWPTRLLGPRYRRSRRFIEIDITYVCNLRCEQCNRSCAQSPAADHMSVRQIGRFLEESRANGVRWERIRILGGEPTLHPQFPEIVDMILRHCREHSPDTAIEVVSNGFGSKVTGLLAQVPAGVHVVNTCKSPGRQAEFDSFNVAPVDLPEYANVDFSNGCYIPEFCGMGLTPYGYYPCAVAGGIDRVFGFDAGRKTLPSPDDDMLEELHRFCRLCGHFKVPDTSAPQPACSPVWQRAYLRARTAAVPISRFPI